MEAIISKIKKLLTMGQDNRTPENERESALRMAHNLLTKHNLDMQDVLGKSMTPEERIDYANSFFGTPWACQIANSIGKMFFCKYYRGAKVTSCKIEHHFVGLESNAITASLMSEWVIASVKKEATSLFGGDTTPGARAFGVGAANKIYRRVNEIIEAATKQDTENHASSCTALAILNTYTTEEAQNEAHLESLGTKLVVKKQRTVTPDVEAYNKGYEYGAKINLNNQIDRKEDLPVTDKKSLTQ